MSRWRRPVSPESAASAFDVNVIEDTSSSLTSLLQAETACSPSAVTCAAQQVYQEPLC